MGVKLQTPTTAHLNVRDAMLAVIRKEAADMDRILKASTGRAVPGTLHH